ncbi:hypothetical protein YPPY52_2058, partial [Yersinia pestis PY-52]
MPGGSQYS